MKIIYPDEFFEEEEQQNTPFRMRKWSQTWTPGEPQNFTVFDNPGYDQMIILKDCEFSSTCSHHLMPFIGKGHIGYIPNGKICGISKLARVLDHYANRPQIQERLTQQVADFLNNKLEPKGVMVVLEAQHDCMRTRGVRKQNSIMITSAIRGEFCKDMVKQEFLRLIR